MSTPSTITAPQSRTAKVAVWLVVGLLLAVLLSACGTPAAPAPAAEIANPPANTQAPAATTAPSEPTATSPAATTDPTATTAPAAASTVSFAKDVLPILQSRCTSCHGGEKTSKGLSMTSYTSLVAGSDNGPVVTANDANGSLVIQVIEQGKMPKRGPKVTPDQLQILIDWINAGAQNN